VENPGLRRARLAAPLAKSLPGHKGAGSRRT